MKSIVVWLQTLKLANQSSKRSDRESRGMPPPQFPPDSISAILVIGTLVVLSLIGTILIRDIRRDNELPREKDAAELEEMQRGVVSLQSEPSGVTVWLDGARSRLLNALYLQGGIN
ncbi:MAG: hypothetical protein WB586_08920 [Chthoniobacterales bacterium]